MTELIKSAVGHKYKFKLISSIFAQDGEDWIDISNELITVQIDIGEDWIGMTCNVGVGERLFDYNLEDPNFDIEELINKVMFVVGQRLDLESVPQTHHRFWSGNIIR